MMFGEQVADYLLYPNTGCQMPRQNQCQNGVTSQLVEPDHHASNFQLLMYTPHQKTFRFRSSLSLIPASLSSFHKHLHIHLTFSLFPQPLLHVSHVLYDLLANETLKNVKMVALFFPNEKNYPTDYHALVYHDKTEY